MNCREFAAHTVAYLDGDLDAERATDCRGHLRTCAGCRALAAEHAQVRDALVELPRVEPPPALWTQINARLAASEVAASERPAWQRALGRLVARGRPLVWPAAMTASACAIALVVVQLRRVERPSVPLASLAMMPAATAAEVAPEVVADRAPSPTVQVALRDAIEEAADQARADDVRFRVVASELLALARAEVATWPAGRAARFDREVEHREQLVLAAAPGRARDRAWHELTGYLERIALADQVATR